MTEDQKTSKIAALNDLLRTTFNPKAGQVVVTHGVMALPEKERTTIFNLVKSFNAFTVDNDPYGEHDFGSITHEGNKVFFKIDYYAPDMVHGSEDPSDPEKTRRVMTIMMANEY